MAGAKHSQPSAPAASSSLESSTNNKGEKPTGPKPKSVNNSQSRRNQQKTHYKAPASKTSWLKKYTGEFIHKIALGDVQSSAAEVTSESGFVVLCSYNWQHPEKKVGSKENFICVPGAPPKWSPLPIGTALQRDTGHQYVDQNASRVPKYPFEPAFRALAIMSPAVQLDGIDIMANRNSFRKLLDFVAGRRQEPFRMDLQMVNNTLFITRREKSAQILVSGALNGTGYGHDFEAKFTKALGGLENSSGHHRVLSYKMGELNCVVQFEVDAQYDDPDLPEETNAEQNAMDSLAIAANQLTISTPHPIPGPLKNDSTRVILKGTNVPSAKLAEIKAKKQVYINQFMPQLWFGRTPYLIVGKHTDGVIHQIESTNVAERFKTWEKQNQEVLRKLVGLLADLRSKVKDMGKNGAVLIRETKDGDLQVLQNMRGGVLPNEIIAKHWSEGV